MLVAGIIWMTRESQTLRSITLEMVRGPLFSTWSKWIQCAHGLDVSMHVSLRETPLVQRLQEVLSQQPLNVRRLLELSDLTAATYLAQKLRVPMRRSVAPDLLPPRVSLVNVLMSPEATLADVLCGIRECFLPNDSRNMAWIETLLNAISRCPSAVVDTICCSWITVIISHLNADNDSEQSMQAAFLTSAALQVLVAHVLPSHRCVAPKDWTDDMVSCWKHMTHRPALRGRQFNVTTSDEILAVVSGQVHKRAREIDASDANDFFDIDDIDNPAKRQRHALLPCNHIYGTPHAS